MNQVSSYSRDMAASREGAFFRRVYNWMVAGLAITGGVAFFTSQSEAVLQLIFGNSIVLFMLIAAELIMVFSLARRINRMAVSTATLLFFVYSGLNGLTLSAIFLAYARADIYTAFLVSAGTFAAMSMYGYTTKRSLAGWGSFLFMGLIGIIIASIVNIFVQSTMIGWIVTYVGVLIFVGLTAYDTQKLKTIAANGFEGEEMEARTAIMGALTLYLDFINLFLMMLRIFGGSRD